MHNSKAEAIWQEFLDTPYCYDETKFLRRMHALATELELENAMLHKRLAEAKERISDYGWAEDARNGNLQGQW